MENKQINTNIFIKYSEFIKENFIVSFFGERNIKEYYVETSLPQDWLNAFKLIKSNIITKYHYEERLINYFESPRVQDSNHHLLLIVGGVGSGKSSSVKYALNKSKICEGCILEEECPQNFSERILVDFVRFENNAKKNEKKTDVILNERVVKKFWQYIIRILDEAINDGINVETEITTFWNWLLEHEHQHESFYNFFDIHREVIKKKYPDIEQLRKLRQQFRESLNKEDLTYYKLYQIKFLRPSQRVNCNFILFDNIDTLPPVLQEKLVEFCEEAYTLLKSKSILLVRPLTYVRNKKACNFIEHIDHSKAGLREVFDNRLMYLKKNKSLFKKSKVKNIDSLISCLEKAINIIPDTKVYSNVFVSTSGRSIRFGLRNFYNFLISPLLTTHTDGVENELLNLNNNTFFQAYFCGESDPQRLDEENFVNLFCISHSTNKKYLSLIKIRIIDLMIKNDTFIISKLLNLLLDFGYKITDINIVINDLLNSRKALIWSSHLSYYTISDLQDAESHVLTITDLGFRYFNKLITFPNYMRECLVPLYNNRAYGEEKNLSRNYDNLNRLENFDLDEIKTFIQKNGLMSYKELYPEEESSLFLQLWLKLKKDILYKGIRYPRLSIDDKKDEHIVKAVNEIMITAVKSR